MSRSLAASRQDRSLRCSSRTGASGRPASRTETRSVRLQPDHRFAMRILYSAIDQTVPGTTGGSVHVTAVAEGLAALGHDVHVLVTRGAGTFPSGPATNPVRWTAMSPPFMAPQLRWMRTGAVRRI